MFGLPFEVLVADVDEAVLPGESPPDYVARLSHSKAEAAAQLAGAHNPALVLAADTAVALDGEIFGKPRDALQARHMLDRLRGRTHHVYSGLTVLDTANGQAVTNVADSPVPMRAYSAEEISAYVATGDPLDKAGAYAIQHQGFHPVENFGDCFASVMGLPLCHVARAMRRLGHAPAGLTEHVPSACQSHLDYDCPVYEAILREE